MHIVLALLGAIVTIAVLLKRLADHGYDLGGLNPFARRARRRGGAKGNPVYAIENPMALAALLMLAISKRDGELTASEKALLLELYRTDFHLSEREAAALLASSAGLLGDGDPFIFNLEKVVAPCKAAITEEQAASTVSLLERVAAIDGGASDRQREFIEDVRMLLVEDQRPEGKWH